MRMKIKKTLILTMLSIFILSSANSSIVKAGRKDISLAGSNRIERRLVHLRERTALFNGKRLKEGKTFRI